MDHRGESSHSFDSMWKPYAWMSIHPMELLTGMAEAQNDQKNKEAVWTSILTGEAWVNEVLNGHRKQSLGSFRMKPRLFYRLCDILTTSYHLQYNGRAVGIEEMVATFLWIVAHNYSISEAEERFQRSSETISRNFNKVLNAFAKMACDWIRPRTTNGDHLVIIENPYYYPHFKGCIGAIDGTHIPAYVDRERNLSFTGRKGTPTQNILAVVDFDQCFTYCVPGWEGSAHDTRIFIETVNNRERKFPIPERDQYYLVDAGYPNMQGFLAPYKGERYHIDQFQFEPPENAKEKFNQRHSSLRSTVERAFGIWKERFEIVRESVDYPWESQVKLVTATMAIHNFLIRSRLKHDYTDFMPRRPGSDGRGPLHPPRVARNDQIMEAKRDEICGSICMLG